MKASELFDVRDKVALVTGAAHGLGSGMAEVLADNGAIVVLADLDTDALAEVAGRLRKSGGRVSTVVVDISNFDAVRKMVDDTAEKFGQLDIVFANAGISAGPGYGVEDGQIENVSMEAWEHSTRINLDGTFVTIQAAARQMKQRRSGSIIVTASIAGVKTSPIPAYAYHAAKSAVAHVVRVAAKELGPHNIRINAIAPGPFRTSIGNGRMHDPEVAGKFTSTVPLGRMATIDEIKGLALLLASSASSYINGAIIPIDGGDSA